MEIHELKKRLKELEEDIFNSIIRFQRDTGLQSPNNVELVTGQQIGERGLRLYEVRVTVEL